jgi:cytochrome P450 family 9
MRATLSPAFTGSKMRQMFDFVSTVGQQTAKTMQDEIKNGSENSFEFKALAMKFTVDVIASSAFGIEVNSFKNPDNDFHRIAKKVTNFSSAKTALKFAGYLTAPKVMKMLKINLLDKESCDFFNEAICETMKIREEKGIIRHDMINLLLQARKGQLAHNNNVEEKTIDGFATVEESQLGKSDVKRVWDDEDLAAQCFIFFLAGFDTVS